MSDLAPEKVKATMMAEKRKLRLCLGFCGKLFFGLSWQRICFKCKKRQPHTARFESRRILSNSSERKKLEL